MKSAQIRFKKPITLKSNLGLVYSFSPGTIYKIKQIISRPNGVDFTLENKVFFRDVDFNKKGIDFVGDK